MSNLKEVRGIGIKGLSLLKKLTINNIEDLLAHYPFRYVFLTKTNLQKATNDEIVVTDGTVETIPTINRFKGKMSRMVFRLNTNDLVVNVVIFNRAFMKSHLRIGKAVTVIGKYQPLKNTIIASEIRLTKLEDALTIEPVYHTTKGLSNKVLFNYINKALDNHLDELVEYIPLDIKNKYNFLSKKEAVKNIHQPSDVEVLKKAKIFLKYEELFLFMLKINYLKQTNRQTPSGLIRDINLAKVEGFINNLPFLLTFDQKRAINDILKDLAAKPRMNRLLQGDVGSGKTVVAFIAMYANYLGGYQSALMAPTEILALQHYQSFLTLFKNINIRAALLTGSLKAREKKQIYEKIKNNQVDIIIGTHALIQEGLEFYNLGLVVTDEQHRFGVNQRANLKNKGVMPDILYMSATPIPRTYALTIYGDMDISNLKNKPSGRKEIITYLKSMSEIKAVLSLMWQELNKNHQIYVVAPLIEESDKLDLSNINFLKEKMTLAFGKKYTIDILHGKMDNKEKEQIMNLFIQNKINILISTTIIEVGIDVTNANMIVIFDADRFGLSTLHQLRGRVGRSDIQSYAILISNTDNERLKILTETNDGFKISEQDFILRGQGELFGLKQSGDMGFKAADLKKDFKILMQAKEDALNLLNNKEFDTNIEYKNLRESLMVLNNLD